MGYKDIYNEWLNNKSFDKHTKDELLAIRSNEKEIEDRFYKELEFGTGGMRGIIGAGTNRINKYIIQKTTQGLSDYILANTRYNRNKCVCIGYDSRYLSTEFAEMSALVLNANGIKTYIFDTLCPTPIVSFAIRELSCIAGIIITASHNPAKYNGYKVYGEDGGQIPHPKDKELISFINKVKDFSKIKIMDKKEAISSNLFIYIGEDIFNKYYKNVLNQSIGVYDNNLKIVYTPLHGTGNIPVREVLKKASFKNVYVVSEQEMPDSNFSSVTSPNPEDIEAFKLAIKLCDKIGGDIIIGTDPDADRLGAILKNKNGEYITLTGNMIGALLLEHILRARKQQNILDKNDTIISTVVSSNMTKYIAKYYGVQYMEVLTGFKFIGEKIKQFETMDNNFVFGFEESYGFLAGTYTRDKDAICAALLLCEIASYYKSLGLSLCDALDELYKKYGYFKENLYSFVLSGIDGLKNINKIMDSLRNNPLKNIIGIDILSYSDYNTSITTYFKTNDTEKITLPKSNVIYFTLEDKSWFCIRPSGTEPKIKIYCGVKEIDEKQANNKLNNLTENIVKTIKNILNNF